MKRFLGKILGIAAVFAVSSSGFAIAQQWPAKPVRVIVNVAPGGVADVTMRLLGARLTETMGQGFLVENRAGGDGYIGFEAVSRAEPDGYTLCYSPGSSMMMAPYLVNRPDLDPTKVLTAIVPTGKVSLYIMVNANSPTNNFAALMANIRANPGKVSYGTPGNGTSPHIAVEVFSREANVKLNHIPYKGAGPALQDLLGGQIDMTFDPGVGLPAAKSGKLRLLAVAGSKRHADFPDAPTLDENGIRGVDGGPHFGFYAPAATPRLIVNRLNQEVNKIIQEAALRDRFNALAVDIAEPMTPEAFAAYVRAQSDRYAKLLPQLGIKL
ncbi:MAG: Bug family tripartite tricarboxylate transporter substrate binding protein [Burkholderiales bacterium]